MSHAGALRRVGGDDLTAEYIQNDWRKADLTEGERAMLEWAEKLTLTPSAMTQDDVQKLRDVGWTDRDILDIAHISAYFNYRVRMVDGLGLLVSDFAAIDAAEARDRAGVLGEERGAELPQDIWGVVQQAEGAKQVAAGG